MKRFFKYFFMVILCSCGAEKSNKNNNSSKMALEDLVITRYIKANEISCNYTHGDTDFKAKSLNSDIISGVLQTNFDIIFPKSLSFKIINELKQSSALGIKITSNNFWRTLSRKTQTILNDYLINNFGGLKDKDFDTKRRLTAYAFTIFTEIENYQQAIKIKATSSHLFKDFIVAFSYDIPPMLGKLEPEFLI